MNPAVVGLMIGFVIVVAMPVRPSRAVVSPVVCSRSGQWPRRSSIARRSLKGDRGSLALVLELLARELRSGRTVHGAVVSVAAGAPEHLGLQTVVDRVASGGSLANELDRWADAQPDEDGALVRAVLQLGLSTGVALADALDRGSATLRARRALDDEIRTLTAQSRTSAALLSLAPVGFFVVFSSLDRSGLQVLRGSSLGWICLLAGVILNGLGLLWMRWLIRSVVDR